MLNYRITQLALAQWPDAGFFGIPRNEQDGTPDQQPDSRNEGQGSRDRPWG
jgi:hypothetical protein